MSPSREEHPLRLIRDREGWTLQEVSDRTGKSKSMLSTIEGGYLPKHKVRVEIAMGIGVMVGEIWPDEYPIKFNSESEQ